MAPHFNALGLVELPKSHRYELLIPTRTPAFRPRTFLRVLMWLRERLSPQASDLEGNLHDTAWIEGVEALVGTIIFEVRAEFF